MVHLLYVYHLIPMLLARYLQPTRGYTPDYTLGFAYLGQELGLWVHAYYGTLRNNQKFLSCSSRACAEASWLQGANQVKCELQVCPEENWFYKKRSWQPHTQKCGPYSSPMTTKKPSLWDRGYQDVLVPP